MDDTLRINTEEICKSLEERLGLAIVALDMTRICSWTDVLIIVTARSRIHMNGLAEAVSKRMKELDILVASSVKKKDQNQWRIIDGGNMVVSLMAPEAREFYSLEKLWFEAEIIYSSSN